jgi:hypothetical protein
MPMNLMYRVYRAFLMHATFLSLAFAQIAPQRTAPYLRQAAITETSEVVHITANSPRPLLQALDALRHKYGWVVNYEDPAYTSNLEIVESQEDPSHLLLPAGGSFHVEFPVAAPLEDQTLRLIVDAYNQSSNPGRFEVRRTIEGGFHVVGTSARNKANIMSPLPPLLDTPVTIAARQRTIADTINLLCRVLAVQKHTSVSVGLLPRALMAYTTVKIGGAKVPARELLIQSLAATRRNVYWCLFFDPTSKGYVLNLHAAKS